MNVTIIGSGVYALAIANLLKENNNITIWTELSDVSLVKVSSDIKVTNSFKEACYSARVIFILTACKFIPSTLDTMKDYIMNDSIIVIGSKGILEGGILPVELAERVLPKNTIAAIGGPTMAKDILNNPVGFTLGTRSSEVYSLIKSIMPNVYLEYEQDAKTVELAGALKNAYAIGSGLIHSMGYGLSTISLYIMRVIEEISNIYRDLNYDTSSIMNLSCLGDLILTCTSTDSRNFQLGDNLTKMDSRVKEEYLKGKTIEGYDNIEIFYKLFKDRNKYYPILFNIYDIINDNKKKEELINIILN